MPDAEQMEFEARLYAIEYLICDTRQRMFALARATGFPDDVMTTSHHAVRAWFAQKTFRGVDPTLSDVAAGALSEAVERLLGWTEEMGAAVDKR